MKQQSGQWQLKRFWRAAAVVILISLSAAIWWTIGPRVMTEEYESFTRPDGNYKVVVLRMQVWPALMPGQSGDAPGLVRLYNRRGEVLHETNVEMVQLVSNVEWREKRVNIKLVAEWELPD